MDMITRVEEAIWFRSKFLEVLKSGEKTGTLRLGRRIPKYEKLPVVLTETRECIGNARIDTLSWIKFGDIIYYPVILQREYPHEFQQIYDEMIMVYPDITQDSWVTFYGFRMEF